MNVLLVIGDDKRKLVSVNQEVCRKDRARVVVFPQKLKLLRVFAPTQEVDALENISQKNVVLERNCVHNLDLAIEKCAAHKLRTIQEGKEEDLSQKLETSVNETHKN